MEARVILAVLATIFFVGITLWGAFKVRQDWAKIKQQTGK